ncbi:uncharacterized protein KIAA1143 homolog [Ostrinia nubilalis]|uniref:uncharacterized protein KIAA1143 homolog n=1 Tax=Ostrinia furnacalis TaxID=93504 RepID=UPI00103C5FC1|nr:uncharacterized protein KIAA1143 homolog [Ostrinia furnacalis]
MNRKRNVNYIKPEDPEFLKVLKRQAGYDDRNHKFDELQNAEDDFAEDDESEKPQVIVLKKGDLTAEEAEVEQKKLEILESNTKADLTQRIIFKTKQKSSTDKETNKRKSSNAKQKESKRSRQLLSFDNDDEED